VIERALRKDPDKRWASASEMASALAAAIEGRSTDHDPGTLVHSAPPEEVSLPARAGAVADGPSALKITLIGMAAVTTLGALAYVVTLGPWSADDSSTHAAEEPIAPEPPALVPESPPPSKPLSSPAVAEEAVAAPAPTARPVPAPPPEQASAEPGAAPQAVLPARAAPGLSPDTLSAILSAAQPSLQRCYEQAMVTALTEDRGPLPALAFEASFGVTPEGRPERVRLAAMKGDAPAELQACLQGVLEGLRYPAAEGPSEARFPIVFQSAVVGP
jgi:hypothetical protein